MTANEAPSGIDPATGEKLPAVPDDARLAWVPMDRDQAVEATNRVNAYAKRLPQVVKEVFDGAAWTALGYEDWDAYVDDALVITHRYANMLLAAAQSIETLSTMFDVDVELFGLPERVLRGLDVGTMVPEITDALAELTEPTDTEKVTVIETTVRKVSKETTKAKAEATAEERMEAARQLGRERAMADLAAAKAEQDLIDAEEEAARAARKAKRDAGKEEPAQDPGSGDDPSSPEPDLSPAQNSVAPSAAESDGASHEETGQPAPHVPVGEEGDETVPPTVSSPPQLPDDWRKRIADATYLLSLDVEDVATEATADDIADLAALGTWCDLFATAAYMHANDDAVLNTHQEQAQ